MTRVSALLINRPRVSRRGLLLVAVCLAQFMVILDVAVVNVALPSIRHDLHFSTIGLQWVVNAYTIGFAGFLLLGGRLADLLGRRRVFVVGTALFALASLGCALASSRGLLIGARSLQGFAGAIVSPATLSIITSAFEEGPERNRALGMWGAIGALGASSGALLGGVLTSAIGWPAIFAVNVPLGVVAVALALRAIPETRGEGARRHFDFGGATLITASLLALTYGVVRTDSVGWGSLQVIGPLAAGVVLLGAFVLVESRLSPAPLVPLSVFRLGNVRSANLVVVLLYAAVFPQWFFLTLYMQEVLHYSPIAAGLGFLPMTLSIFFGSTIAPRVVARFGARRVIAAGMLSSTAGGLLLSGISPGSGYLGIVVVGGVLSALGMGFALVPATIAAMEGVPAGSSGLASGLLNASRLMGGALGLAVLSTVAAGQSRGVAPIAQGMTDGFGAAFELAALFCLVGAVIAAGFLRARGPADAEPGADQQPESERPESAIDEPELVAA